MSSEDDIELDDGEQQLVAQLRALPGEGREPDWAQLEREIHAAVGPQVPVPWWRASSWRWLVPLGALGALAVILFVVVGRHEPARVAHVTHDAGAAAPVVEAAVPKDEALWLDGEAVEVGDAVDPSVLIYDDVEDGDEVAGTGLLPVDDLRWIDSLDDGALERAEHWLDKKGHAKG